MRQWKKIITHLGKKSTVCEILSSGISSLQFFAPMLAPRHKSFQMVSSVQPEINQNFLAKEEIVPYPYSAWHPCYEIVRTYSIKYQRQLITSDNMVDHSSGNGNSMGNGYKS